MRQARRRLGLTQAELALAAGVGLRVIDALGGSLQLDGLSSQAKPCPSRKPSRWRCGSSITMQERWGSAMDSCFALLRRVTRPRPENGWCAWRRSFPSAHVAFRLNLPIGIKH